MNHLTITERASLRRHHGITVTRECEGVAHCIDRAGNRQQYAIEHLKECAKPGIAWRLRQWRSEPMTLGQRIKNWIAGVSA